LLPARWSISDARAQQERNLHAFSDELSTEQEIDMSFIERLLGFAPDGGNGSLEMILFLIPLAGTLLFRAWHSRRHRI
jgi:hypothetical protein